MAKTTKKTEDHKTTADGRTRHVDFSQYPERPYEEAKKDADAVKTAPVQPTTVDQEKTTETTKEV